MDRPARLLAVVAMTAAAVALAACSGSPDPSQPAIPPGITAPPPTPVASPTAEAPQVESQLPAEIAGVDTADWQQIPAVDGTVTFRIPPEWSTEPRDGALAVLRDDGEQQLALELDAETGDGRCVDADGTAVAWRTLGLQREAVEVAGAADASFAATALQLGDQWIVSMGILPTADAASPRCPIVNAVETAAGALSFASEAVVTGGGAGSPWQVGSLADAQAYVDTDEFREIRAILMSLEVVQQ